MASRGSPRLRNGQSTLVGAKKLCGTAFACEADARQALSTYEHSLQATFLHEAIVRSTPRYGKQGRPRQGAQPNQVVYQVDGALASRVAVRQALVEQHSCFILATNELDTTQLPPQEVCDIPSRWAWDKCPPCPP